MCKVSIDEGKGAYGDKTRKAHQGRINDGEGASLHKARNLADLSKRLEGCYCNTDDTRARPSLEIQTKY